jgi:SAM-dependent methyltransferase
MDVDAAAGFVVKGLVAMGSNGGEVEPGSRMAECGREVPGLEIVDCTLEELEPAGQFDLVNMIQVVPHFLDIREALQAVARVTRTGGFWLIETWDRRSREAQLMRGRWHEYSPSNDFLWFTRDRLNKSGNGFAFVEIPCGRPQKWISGSHARVALEGKLSDGPPARLLDRAAETIADRLAVLRPGDDLFWAKNENVKPDQNALSGGWDRND